MDEKKTEQKLVLKVAEKVWAANKYFVLACSQQQYLKIRQYLRPDNPQLIAAFETLQAVEEQFRYVERAKLPQIENSLYHMAGYFKTFLSNEQRRAMDVLIRQDPHEALQQLEQYTSQFAVQYLAISRVWPSQQETVFNELPVSIKHKGETYLAKSLTWHGDYVVEKEI